MGRSRNIASALTVALAAICAVASAGELEEAAEASAIDTLLGESERCISTRQIDRTEVIDQQTIVFYLSGGRIYVNRLPHRCPGLRTRDGFMYKNATNRLCSIDTIRVLDTIGGSLRPGVGCGLGEFHPVSADTVEQLKLIDED
jgi:hypothetical protein